MYKYKKEQVILFQNIFLNNSNVKLHIIYFVAATKNIFAKRFNCLKLFSAVKQNEDVNDSRILHNFL